MLRFAFSYGGVISPLAKICNSIEEALHDAFCNGFAIKDGTDYTPCEGVEIKCFNTGG